MFLVVRFAQDSSSARNIAAFLTDLADLDPASVLRSSGVGVLLPHLDGEAYVHCLHSTVPPCRKALRTLCCVALSQGVVSGLAKGVE